MTGCSKTSTDVEKYLNTGTAIDAEAKDMMPALEYLPEYSNIEYRYTQETIFIFKSNSVALVVEYDDQTYESEKEKLQENYTFSNLKNSSDVIDETTNPLDEFSINSYAFQVIEGDEFPKSFGMIGTSDEKQRIAYLYYYDSDLNTIGDHDDSNCMATFVKRYFNYHF